MRVLILGGTSEAMALARLLAREPCMETLYSLAGRTSQPETPPVSHRSGGFGGVEGLAAFLREGDFHALIDATHPFAAQMSRNAALACAATGLAICALTRPHWQAGPGDMWLEVADMARAASVLGKAPCRVFLTTGRLGLQAFEAAPHHTYLIRSIDPLVPAPALDHVTLQARPPFTVASETALMLAGRIDVLVTKNSGANATAAKLQAARILGLPVIMVQRPALPAVPQFSTPEAVLEWLRGLHS